MQQNDAILSDVTDQPIRASDLGSIQLDRLNRDYEPMLELCRLLLESSTLNLRAVYEVSADKGYIVSDVTIEGRPIRFGAQIADFVTIKLASVATRFGQSTVASMTSCRRDKALDENISLESFAVGSALDLERMATR